MSGREETNRRLRRAIEQKTAQDPVLNGFFLDMDAAGLEMKTCYAYLNMVSHFLREVKVPLKEIQVQDVNQYISSLKKGDKPQTYLRTLWYCLNRYFGYLVRTGEVGENIMERVIKPKAKPNREIKRTCLTPEEYQLLLSAARRDPDDWQSARNTAIIRILIETGIRVSALTEINVEDILPEQHAIRITDKENKTTDYPISIEVMKDLLAWFGQRRLTKGKRPNEPALFLSARGGRLQAEGVREIFVRYKDAVPGKHITPHKLRASFATNLYNQTGDIRLVQEAMNHAKIATTELYIQSDGRNRKKAADIMSQLLKGE